MVLVVVLVIESKVEFHWELQSNQPKPVLVEGVGPNRTQPKAL